MNADLVQQITAAVSATVARALSNQMATSVLNRTDVAPNEASSNITARNAGLPNEPLRDAANSMRTPRMEDDDDFQMPSISRYRLPSLYGGASHSRQRRRASTVRAPRHRSTSKEVFCLPFSEGNIFPIPRGSNRTQLGSGGFSAFLHISSTYTESEVRQEIASCFRSAFGIPTNEEFKFRFLWIIQGTKKLQVANTSESFSWGGSEVMSTYPKKMYIMSDRRHILSQIEELSSSEEQVLGTAASNSQNCSPTREVSPMVASSIESGLTTRDRSLIGFAVHLPNEPVELGYADLDPSINIEINTLSASEVLEAHAEQLIDKNNTQTIVVRRGCFLEDTKRWFLRKDFKATSSLYVIFVGEPGVDAGGPRREFLDMLRKKLVNWPVFEGEVGNLNISSSVPSLLQNYPYVLGVAVGLILVHGGLPVPIFCRSVVDTIAGKDPKYNLDHVKNLPLKDTLQKVLDDPSLPLPPEVLALKEEIGLYDDISEANKSEFINMVCHYVCGIKNGAHIAKFVEGLQVLQVGDLIKKYPDAMMSVLCGENHNEQPLTGNTLFELFEVELVESGSNLRLQQDTTLYHFLLFLEDCCSESVAVDSNGITTVCTYRDFLQYLTGSSCVPLFGSPKPKLKFFDEPFPVVSTCEPSLTLPTGLEEFLLKDRLLQCVLGCIDFGRV